ncbi:DUF4097 family beta strand repeat-containing protein [Granulicella cerasi]|uniref:DUF4097 family beta strand repeat-containing protein n=1 Tax=Granulicella cerasi TaxID=741063 RepID=A0ABW1ZDL4_9BACT|nr:DUF4097 family beta strand repeat-containing protein [Granulicella cerasi]
MAGYPPPPPQGQYPPPYDRNSARAQQQAFRAQAKAFAYQQKQYARAMRDQARAQRRAMRRRSIVGPVILIALGVLFLLTQLGHLHWPEVFFWMGHWWPLVLIIAGIVMIGEWFYHRSRSENYYAPSVNGGVIFLLILIVSIGASAGWMDRHSDEIGHGFFDANNGWSRMMGESHDFDDSLTESITPAQTLVLRNVRGDLTLTGSSTDNQVHLDLHKQVYAWQDSDAQEKADRLKPAVTNDSGQLLLAFPDIEGATNDLTVEVPHNVTVIVSTDRGDINVSQIHGSVSVTAKRGGVDLNGIAGPVDIHTSFDDANVSAHSITGQVTLQGRAGDLSFTDINGGLSLEGDFFGSTHVERVNGVTRFQTSRTQFQVARLDGELDLSGGADFRASQVLGPVTLTTRNRNITLDRVEGRIQVNNRNGSVDIVNAAPIQGISVTNEKGSVDIGLPDHAGFTASVSTRRGDVENDFNLQQRETSGLTELHGPVNGGGATVSVTTTDGDITLRKASVEPLPPTPPTAPKLTIEPPPPPTPEKPKQPSKPKKPTAPAATTEK